MPIQWKLVLSISAVKVMLWLSGMKILGAQEDTFAETTTSPFLTVMLGRSVGEGAAEALAVAEGRYSSEARRSAHFRRLRS